MAHQSKKAFGGKWSDEKLDALREYLAAYMTALKKTSFKLVYIDAFAGAGTREITQEQEEGWFDDDLRAEDDQYRHGSPLIALDNEPAFDQFIFIEQDAQSLEKLKKEVEETNPAKAKQMQFMHGDANQHLQELAKMKIWDSHRAVAFLDPFALHVRWETIELIAKTKAIDMWLLFPAMAVNRMLTKSGEIPDSWASKLTETFGSDNWREFFYAKSDADLFGDEMISKIPKFFERLSKYITLRLETVFAGAHDKPLILRNSAKAPLFLLCFACGNPKGKDIAKRIAQHIINKKNHGH